MATTKRLIFLPLGGAGEIGMNMYLYGYGAQGKERFILVDVGVTFPDMETSPGVDLIMADPAYIEERLDRLDGIFITHAHEDHIGAIGMLYPRLKKTIYCRKFTAAVARAKMEDRGQDASAVEVIEPYPFQVKMGEMMVGFLPVPHSIPEASGLVIDTPKGRIVHTGDLKLDKNPIVGEAFDEEMFKKLGDEGVHALVCDSTNVFSHKEGRSEETLIDPLTKMIKSASGMVVATTFASNIARLKTLAQAGADAGRKVCVLGRSMQRMRGYAESTGVLTDFPSTIDLDDVHNTPRDQLMLLVTGSQGERRAASGQLAAGKYLGITLKPDDTFLFSSKTIPGNEVGVGRIINSFAKQGVRVIDDSSDLYHVSGHANRPDLERLHDLMKPNMLIPMHGEYRHLREHAELASHKGINSIIAENGTMVDLSGKKPVAFDHIETGRKYMDGSRLIGAYDGVVLERLRMAIRGTVAVSLVIEDDELLGVWADPLGLPDTMDHEEPLVDLMEAKIENALVSAKPKSLRDDKKIEDLVIRALNKVCKDEVGKKPVIKVLINRLTD